MQDRLSKFCAWFWVKWCLFTAYLHVIAIFIEIGTHILLVLVLTSGLQCNTNLDALHKKWTSIEKIIHIPTLGIHGFTPFLIPYTGLSADHEATLNEKLCCSGILHLPVLDSLIITLNLIWFKFVLSFCYSLHEKDTRRMRLFLKLALIKLFIESVYKGMGHNISEHMFNIDISWNSEIVNFCLFIVLMTPVHYYIKFLQRKTSKASTIIIELQNEVNDKVEEKTEQPIAEEKEDKPPAYALV